MTNFGIQERVQDLIGDKGILIYLTEFGSVLYGTNTPASDTDYKAIYLPHLHNVILDNAPNTIEVSSGSNNSTNGADDIDITIYSLQHFIKLLSKGEVGAIDILFSLYRKDTQLFYDTLTMDYIKQQSNKLVSKQSKAFVGYCMQQASRYGIKGSRYSDLSIMDKFLDSYAFHDGVYTTAKIATIQSQLPELVYVSYITKDNLNYIQILGKLHQDNITIEELHNRVKYELSKYGGRSRSASKGVDWKALSHAYRVIYQFEELCTTGTITFPLASAEAIKEIKYCTDEAQLPIFLEQIHTLLTQVDISVADSTLPQEVNKTILDTILLRAYNQEHK